MPVLINTETTDNPVELQESKSQQPNESIPVMVQLRSVSKTYTNGIDGLLDVNLEGIVVLANPRF
jgi:cell division transport system ATP-binding protein